MVTDRWFTVEDHLIPLDLGLAALVIVCGWFFILRMSTVFSFAGIRSVVNVVCCTSRRQEDNRSGY